MKIFIFSVITDYENCPLVIRNNVYRKYEDCFDSFSEEYERKRADKNLKLYSGGSSASSNGKHRLFFEKLQDISNMRNTIKLDINELEVH